jgi:hypothetical protein
MIDNIAVISRKSLGYIVKVYTGTPITRQLGRAFISIWNEMISFRKRRVEIGNREIRIYLRKGDTVQKYIDHATCVFCQAEIKAALLQKRKVRRKYTLLKKEFEYKSYLLKKKAYLFNLKP